MSENKKSIEEVVAEMQAQLAAQAETIAAQAESIASFKAAKLEQEPEAAKKPEIPKEAVKVGKKSYKFKVAAFYMEGKKILSEDAALDEELLAKIVAINGQNILSEKV